MSTTLQSAYDTLSQALTETFRIPAEELSLETTIGSLELDSLALAELAVSLSERLGVSVTEEGVTAETTLGDFAQGMADALAAAHRPEAR
ncbi:acyl carrier protein [Streptomyces sp. CJ_13]|uniref:acyl carrier protein n=1 Tax=Streptomyces TaxID=1883 RepID=UPI001BDC5D25|nr:acyl carrier protein [Streptomyces sp. CJ_13]MBT1187500.1 acyl carrier protein [Streptomyces sp. CJ_13]